jgi:hypothetical protein
VGLGRFSWLARNALVLATGLTAALPILVVMIRTIAADWTALGDNAITAVRAFDVFTAHSPLVGQSSGGATSVLDQRAFCPGPLLYWLLAVQAHFLDPVWMAITAGLVNVASVMGVVALARRRGGLLLMFATAAAIPLMLLSIPAHAYSDPWNPWLPLMPFLLLIFLAWSLACGEVRLLPVAVLVASFVAQTHLAFLLPAAGAMAVGLAGLVLSRRRRRRAAASAYARRPRSEPGSARPWAIAAVLVLVVCWTAPVVEQATHRPGNFVLLARAASTDQPTLGASAGAYAVARTVGVRPWWLRAPRGTEERIVDLQARPGVRNLVSTIAVLAGLIAVALVARRRRRHDVVAAVALVLVLCAIVGMNAAAVPEPAIATVGYTMLWASPAGMVVWLVLGWSIVTLVGGSRFVVRPGRPALLGLGGVVIVAAVAAVAADPPFEPFDQMRTADERAVAATHAGEIVRVDRSAQGFWPVVTAVRFQAGLVYALRRHGRAVRAPVLAEKLGSLYRAGPAERALRVDVDRPPPPGGRTVMRFLVHPRSSSLGLAPQVVRITSRRLPVVDDAPR